MIVEEEMMDEMVSTLGCVQSETTKVSGLRTGHRGKCSNSVRFEADLASIQKDFQKCTCGDLECWMKSTSRMEMRKMPQASAMSLMSSV
ncbi:hypothetical protein SIAM614_28282 [Stappia aggregata IAM 12614]|uniref:Uncharacterized protein n=2 Tax=Roseibium aggregatum TaxID=187304 RepID=A0NXL5_ROSAI|nr:hypothetical protein SIAM614_28282 [Stappia aggregata IAM 12614] [Roseibium aggregatum IAM 12614]